MRRRHMPTPFAILAIMLVMFGSVLLLVGVIERAVAGFAGNLPNYQAAFLAQTDKIWALARGERHRDPERAVA